MKILLYGCCVLFLVACGFSNQGEAIPFDYIVRNDNETVFGMDAFYPEEYPAVFALENHERSLII